MSQTRLTRKLYFAGDLFDHKHLIGNHLLADFIHQHSEKVIECVLPQQFEPPTGRSVAIRDLDLKLVLDCDVALFNFDGTDLDSGTVVEFMLAKMLDIPCVILRTDIRLAGDQSDEGDPWNLMVSGYPRSQVLKVNALALYRKSLITDADLPGQMYGSLAQSIVAGLRTAVSEPTLFSDESDALAAYTLAARFPGSSFEALIASQGSDYLRKLVQSKRDKGIYSWSNR